VHASPTHLLDRPDIHSASRSKGGKAGGKACARALTKEQRQEIARKAAAARWGKKYNARPTD
jgi:hypothetical protein